MGRRQKILKHVDAAGLGLEIGPGFKPLAAKRDGFRVEILDHLDRDGLVAKYRDHGVDVSRIEPVDHVWRGGSLVDLIGQKARYDWIIASHVIEHTPDLIGFLNDCAALLRPGGVLSLVVPDKRYCFDHLRPVSGLGRVIDAHEHPRAVHSPGSVAEFLLNAVSRGRRIAWDATTAGALQPRHSVHDAVANLQAARRGEDYLDVHAWCFVPQAFRLLIHDLHALGLITLQEVDFAPTDGCEFYVTLGAEGGGYRGPRLDLARAALAEEAAGVGSLPPVLAPLGRLLSLWRRVLRRLP